MDITFNIDVNLNEWAKAIGYNIVGDKLVRDDSSKKYKLADFKEEVRGYISAMLDAGWNLNAIQENFFANDTEEFKVEFECNCETSCF